MQSQLSTSRMETTDGPNFTTGQTMITEEFDKREENFTTEEEENEEVQYGRPDEILYFTNRFELGLENCYDKLSKVSKVLGSVSHEEFKDAEVQMARQAQKDLEQVQHEHTKKDVKLSQAHKPSSEDTDGKNEFGFSDDLITGYKVKVEAKGLDYKGREISSSKNFDSLEIAAAYLKLINVPCMFDIGTQPVNPCDSQLNLNMIDDVTFSKVI